ncbi:TPM domain-containing protein [Marinicrinis lubricantis]|uniref:TPM domain-containing protein n=1 Tax=Marinicrinis lubricantis TaxID=2086470 RepID=A0ABW1INV3_9BACL
MVKRIYRLPMITLMSLIFLVLGNGIIFASDRNVYDEAQLFTPSQVEELQQRAVSLGEKWKLDIVMVTTNDVQGKTSRQYAEDFYNAHQLGYGNTQDGILYLLNMNDREVYILTKDRGVDLITDRRVEEMLDKVYPYLSEDAFGESAHAFLDEVDIMMQRGIPEEGGSLLQELAIYSGISIVIGAVVVGVMAGYNRGRSTVNSRTYLDHNSLVVDRRNDQYKHTRVTQQRIQRSSGKGSSGSSRTGGGGRSF